MEELDLDINNYSLNEILSLFKLPLEFDERDMKKAKRIVLMTHPDKSKRDKKYFLFFSSAYKILFEVYKFRQRQSNPTEYENYSLNMDNQDKNVNKILEKFSNKKGFNKKFNELFETYYIRSEEDYEEKQKFRNVFSLNTFRKQDELKFKETDQEEIYKQNKMRENREDMERAYKLARQQEMNSKIRENFMSSLLRITNKNV